MNNPFWDQQQKMYKDFVGNYFGQLPGFDAYQKAYTAMEEAAKTMQNPFAAFMSVADNKNPWANMTNPWLAMMPNAEAVNKFWADGIPGLDVYGKLFDFWKSMDNPAEFIKNYNEKYMDMMQDLVATIMPEGASAFIQKPRELINTCLEFYKSIMQPWLEIDPKILSRIAEGDQTAYVDFFREVNSKYEDTFGKLFNMMGLGLNREKYERQMRAMNLYYKVMFATGEVFAMIQNTLSDSMNNLLESYRVMMEEGKNVTTFKEFYDLWYKVNEDSLTKLLDTEAFSKGFGALSDVSAKYLQAMNEVYEEVLSTLPIPTKTDMDSLYKTVYDLRKDMRDVKNTLKEMNK